MAIEGQRTRANLSSWLKDPSRFLGNLDRSSDERWSFESIQGLEDRYPGQCPFHKLNLALHLKRRIRAFRRESNEGHFIEIDCKKAMMIECYPRYNTLDEKAKANFRRRYDRYIEQGGVLQSIWNISAGLMLIIAPLLTQEGQV